MAIVGRPNVGKSTLFNRLIKRREAIVDSVSGVTRDRNYGKSEWNGKEFSVIDTGGYIKGSDDIFEAEIRKQVEIAIDEANVILFVVDVMTGITDLDEMVAEMLRKSKKRVFIAANKVDNTDRIGMSSEFYSFGLGDIYDMSAVSGSGTGDLLDEVVKHFDKNAPMDEPDIPRVAVVGKPNVGKSSLINALTGQERNIVTEISGTTRDAINTRFNAFGHDFILIDTAGIRKKSKVHEDIEYYSVLRSVRAIENADVCVFMIDATEGVQKQDLSIFYIAEKNHKGVVVLVNKWDLIEKETNTARDYEKVLKDKLAPFTDVPVLFISELEKKRIFNENELALDVFENRHRKVPTSKLNDIMLKVVQNYQAPVVRGHIIKIKFVSQLPTRVPSFAYFTNFPDDIKTPYRNYLENQIRANFKFTGVPVRIYFRKK